jgi:IS30 family transposase
LPKFNPIIGIGNAPRQYFPKGINFGEVTDKVLALAVKKINHRPRKCLDYQAPHAT